MSSPKTVKTTEQAKEIILDTLEDLNLIAIAEEINKDSCCWFGTASIHVKNLNGDPVWVQISQNCGRGNTDFFEIPPGRKETWSRCVWREVDLRLRIGGDIEDVISGYAVQPTNKFEVNGSHIS